MRAFAHRLAAAAAAVASIDAMVSGQAPEPAPIPYVASVKPNMSGSGTSFTRRLPGGTFLVSNMAVRDFIAFVHGLQPFQIEGAPDWIGGARFDITIKAEANVGPVAIGPTQIGLQLGRALLEDRFSFRAHRETRERPVLVLVRARQDGPLGPRLRQSATDCAALAAEAGKTNAPWPPRSADGRLLCGLNTVGSPMTAGGYPMSEFVRWLTGQTQRMVIDRTGLAGGWDFELTFAPPDVAAAASSDAPTLFTALEEQLGLKLDSTRAPADVLVVDRIERPMPD
jgi:bla regulator protein blaR1